MIYVFVLTGFFWGCSSPTGSGNPIPNHPIQNSDVLISGIAQVQTPSNSGKAVYSVVCRVGYRNQSEADSVFNSSTITVDGLQLTRQNAPGTFYGSGLMLSTGDSVVFTIRHPLIGTIVQSLRVPPSLTDCLLQPRIPPSGVANTSSDYSIAWGTGAVGATYYTLKAVCYDSLKEPVAAWSTSTSSNTLAFPSWLFQENSGGVTPYVDITLLPFYSISYPGFASGSRFSVSSADYKEYSNL